VVAGVVTVLISYVVNDSFRNVLGSVYDRGSVGPFTERCITARS
jgi:hypothetical protein